MTALASADTRGDYVSTVCAGYFTVKLFTYVNFCLQTLLLAFIFVGGRSLAGNCVIKYILMRRYGLYIMRLSLCVVNTLQLHQYQGAQDDLAGTLTDI